MQDALPPFAALRALIAVAEAGGIRRGAERLGVSHAIVSRHVRGLEQRLGCLLLDRRTGRLTAKGATYYARISAAVGEITAATRDLRFGESNRLVICASPGFALHWLAKRLAGLPQGKGRPMVELRATDEEPNLSGGEADGDIRYLQDGGKPSQPRTTRSVELARPFVFPVASPDVAERVGRKLRSAADFLRLPLIEEGDSREWRAWLAAQGVHTEALPPSVRYGHAHLALAAACAGQGIALGNQYLLRDDLASGRLMILGATEAPFVPVALGAYVFRSARERWDDRPIASFRKWVAMEIASG